MSTNELTLVISPLSKSKKNKTISREKRLSLLEQLRKAVDALDDSSEEHEKLSEAITVYSVKQIFADIGIKL